ncbi:MAG: hypothetical protein JXR16_07115 [Bermanella sp.]
MIALLCACSDKEYTVVELHHLEPSTLASILNKQLGEDIEYDISGKSIIFYAGASKLTPIITLLNSLDKPPSIYTLTFAWASKYKRSTTQLPHSITIQSSTPNTIKIFDSLWQTSIDQINQDQVLLTLIQKNNANEKEYQQIFFNDPKGVIVQRVESQTEPQLLKQQFVLTLNTKERINHDMLPKDLVVTVTRLE